MPTRPELLQVLIDNLLGGIVAQIPSGSEAEAAMDRVRASLATPGQAISELVAFCQSPSAVTANLPSALAAAQTERECVAAVAGALEALLPQITWYTREGLTSRHSDFAERHALATLVGPAERPGVLEVRDDVIVGISLLAPLTEYPDHRHPPEELYLALTPGEWRQDLGAWFEPGPGGIVYNTSNILHGMRAGASPQLALWCLPT